MDLGVRFGTQIPVGTDPGHPRVHSCPALIDMEPSTFHTGDIVEASIEFVCIPLKDNHFMMTHQLRALTFLDDSIHKVSTDGFIVSILMTYFTENTFQPTRKWT